MRPSLNLHPDEADFPRYVDLTEPIDVYSEWIDAADAAQREEQTTRRGHSSSSRPIAPPAPPSDDDDDDDDDD